ncbi:ATP-binding protein [Arcobacter sp. YIC-464]|uniref:ATP-binding protein n=1 Tax=Arcobacter sp. YIC-464 TaxID=3376631 RepID=UPI003C195712
MRLNNAFFNIFKNSFLRNIFIFTCLLLLLIPTLLFNFMNENFQKEMYYNIEDDAKRVAKHIETEHFKVHEKIFLENIGNVVKDFNIYKLRYFDKNGYITASTDKKEINTKSMSKPFYEIVTKGIIYHKVVQKGMQAEDGKIIPQDVVEIYIPLMKNNEFKGAFELYYNITQKLKRFKEIQLTMLAIQIVVLAIIFILLIIIMYKASVNELERDEKEKELLKQKELANKASQSKSDFLANMSHELRTPLNAIIGFNKILLDDEKDEEKKKKLSIINSSSKTLLQLIHDVLDISKIETGKIELNKIEFNFIEEVKSICEGFTYQLNQKSIFFELNIDENIPKTIVADSLRIKQIFLNLMSNAIKFTPKNKCIKVNVDYDSIKSIITINVLDEGIGIEKNKLDLIFEKFTQEDSSTTRLYGGTGLGLPISRSLANIMNGDILVKSIKNQGSTFSFYFPIDLSEKSESIEVLDDKTDKNINKEIKILLAEDNELNQMLFVEILKDSNAQITIANNGIEALEYYKSKDFDIIFMDDKMPEMDGRTTIENINKLNEKHPPIIAFTANALSSDKEEFFSLGVVDFLSKPVETDVLKELIIKHTQN